MESRLLKAVSRSFSITIELLPESMRRPVGLAYLLARAGDTLADTGSVGIPERIERLDGFIGEMEGGHSEWRRDLRPFLRRQTHSGERHLLEGLGECVAALEFLPERQAELVREVVAIVTSGQRMDLERTAGDGWPLSAAELLDYCRRVAGCVGVFWTRIGFEALGGRFSGEDPKKLEEDGQEFGVGLQLVNILRDVPEDLGAGRCYLPVDAAGDHDAVMRESVKWRARARQGMEAGKGYAAALGLRRLRAATVLPALIGERTLDLLDHAGWEELEDGVKVDRWAVRRCLGRSLTW